MLYQLVYINMFIYIIFTLILLLIILLLAFIISKNPLSFDKNRNSIYECGFEPFQSSRISFEVHFYLIGILFIIFDIEIAFLYPWVLNVSNLNTEGFYSMYFFLILLILGFFYEIKNNILDW